MAYVYEHWRPDLDRPFWVGKGSGGRAHLVARRNKHHAAIVAKLAAVDLRIEVRIVADNLTDAEAFELEKTRIEHWHTQGVRLANQSVGGRGGATGMKRSAESRAKQRATMMGRKLSPTHAEKARAHVRSPEMRARAVATHTGRTRPSITGKRISAGNKAVYADPVLGLRRRAAIAAANTGKKVSEETRAKQRAAKTPEARKKISDAVKLQWQNPEFRSLVSETMRRTNARRRATANA